MDNSNVRALLLALVVLVVVSTASITALVAGGGSSGGGVSAGQVEDIVFDYLKKNPQVIVQAFEQARAEQEAKDLEQASAAIAGKRDELENNPSTPFAGNQDGDVTIVEFFDYNCGYCKRVVPDFITLLNEDKNLKIVFKDFPILGEQSVTIAKAALAVNKIAKDKFWNFHTVMMQQTPKTNEQLFARATELGIDAEQLKAEIEKPEYAEKIQSNLGLGQEVGIRGTPGFIINGEIVRGAIGVEEFRRMIDKARKG